YVLFISHSWLICLPFCSFFFFYAYCALRALHSFPTRRSSDLGRLMLEAAADVSKEFPNVAWDDKIIDNMCMQLVSKPEQFEVVRSEEHTSELQSRENLVCRLLLEKKKKNIMRHLTPRSTQVDE